MPPYILACNNTECVFKILFFGTHVLH